MVSSDLDDPVAMDGRWRHARIALVLVAVVSLVATAALYVLAVRTAAGQRIDERAVMHHHFDRTTDADATHYLDALLVAIASTAAFALWVGRRQRRLSLVAILSVTITYVGAIGLRDFVLHRVDLVGHDSLYGPSFPSGHTAFAAAVALGLVLVGGPTRRTIALAAVLAASVSVMVVLIPIHRPSDVLGGQLLALSAVSATLAFVPGALGDWNRSPKWRREGQSSPWSTSWTVLAAGLVLTSCWLLFTELLAHRSGHRLSSFGRAYPFALAAVVWGAVGVIEVLLLIGERVVCRRSAADDPAPSAMSRLGGAA